MTAHIDYFLKVDESLVSNFSDNPINDSRNTSRKVGAKYFKIGRSRIPKVDDIRVTYAEDLYEKIIEAINDACEDLIAFWHRGIPEYFYRTEQGQYGSKIRSGDYLGAAMKELQRKAVSHRGHTTTGRLREALFIYDLNINGAVLAIKELPSTSTHDYVAILKSGAGPNPYAPYDPNRHIRLVNTPGSWGGFPRSYWKAWDDNFRKELQNVQSMLDHRIEEISENILRQETRDLRKMRRGTTEDIAITTRDRLKKARDDTNKTRPLTRTKGSSRS